MLTPFILERFMWRIFTRRRVALGCSLTTFLFLGLVGVLALIGPSYRMLGTPGYREYCDPHFVNETVAVRLTYIPYSSTPSSWAGPTVDPNNWEHRTLAFDFMPHRVIQIPDFDYEITFDKGVSWKHFWTYDNYWDNRYPQCDHFSSLDVNNFWVWQGKGTAITHDGGKQWLTYDFVEDREPFKAIDYVGFDTPDQGRIVFVNARNTDYTTLLTDDGGENWYEDPNWVNPT